MGPWRAFQIALDSHSEEADSVYILRDKRGVVEDIDMLLTNVNNISTSRFLNKQKKQVNKLRMTILQVSDFIDEWIKFENQWLYLVKIFTSHFKKELTEVK